MLTEDQILDALRACYDPEIPLNVVELGLVQRVVLRADPDAPGAGIPGVPQKQTLTVDLISTSSDEAARGQLTAQVHNRLAGLERLSRISVRLLASPAWTPQSITPEGRRQLKLDQPAFPILNNRVR
jgi:metal-sulfur cluster biosynthetic enzyme